MRVTHVDASNGSVAMRLTNDDSGLRNVVAAAPSAVWTALPATYRSLGLPGSGVVNATAHVYGMARYQPMPRKIAGERLGRFLTCGSGLTGSSTDRDQVYLRALTQVDSAAGGTIVTTRLDAYARPRFTSGGSVVCGTEGTLENLLADSLQARLRRTGEPPH